MNKGINNEFDYDSSAMIYMSQENCLCNYENYGRYVEFVKTGRQTVFTGEITRDNWRLHLDWITNILKDGIEQPIIQDGKFTVIFVDMEPGDEIELSIFDYFFNIMLWSMFLNVGDVITPKCLYFNDATTKGTIKDYIDDLFLKKYVKHISKHLFDDPENTNIFINRTIDEAIYELSRVDDFSMYIANTINLEDYIDLMNQYKEFDQLMALDLSSEQLTDIKNAGLSHNDIVSNYILNSNHCLSDSIRAKQGVNIRQHKEFATHIGTRPDGEGGIFPASINRSFLNGGVADPVSFFLESHNGRTAQIITKCNVGSSGHFARILGLNNKDMILNIDPEYDCHSENYIEMTITNKDILKRLNNRYYKATRRGVLKRLDSSKDERLIGQTLLFRSPMTCACAHKNGICYTCYGDLAYINAPINAGKLAAELLSSDLTQRLLSAKHLLETKAIKIKWFNDNIFRQLFYFDFNTIKLSEEDNIDWTGFKLIINSEDIHMESEEDDFDYNEYIDKFIVAFPDGQEYLMYTESFDPIYISSSLNNRLRHVEEDENGNLVLDMSKLADADIEVFVININNDELGATLDRVKSLLNKEAATCSLDKNSWIQELLQTVIDGGLDPMSVHLEVLLANQLRKQSDILEAPDWSLPNQSDYQLLTLNKALTNNPSVTTSLSYQKLAKMFYDPLTYRKKSSSVYDLLFMERPQEFMSDKNIIDKTYVPKTDIEKATPLVTFKKED